MEQRIKTTRKEIEKYVENKGKTSVRRDFIGSREVWRRCLEGLLRIL